MQPELQSVAFSAWDRLLHNLEDDDVETMLESTFSTIIQRWESFNEVTRQRAETTLQYLLKQRTRLIRNMIVNLPSLSQFPQLKDVEKQLNKIRTPTDVGNAFQIFSRRVSHETSGVVAQALVELKEYLRINQSFLQASAISERPDAVIGVLVRSILDACVKFNEAHHDIAQLAAECIGLIGCLDPNRVESVREQSEMVVVSNFEDPGETTDFVLYLLKEVIVKAFLSTTDTGVQGFLSLVMQRLLEVCNFKEVCPSRIMIGEGRDSPNHVFRKWMALPGSVQETLTPFLTSKFTVKEMDRPNVEYPIFRSESIRSCKIYRFWLGTFVLELLYKPYNLYAELVFPPLRRAIKIRNLSIANFLLPYVVLHVIVDGTDQDRNEIVEELLGVLKYQSTAEYEIQEEDLKMCSEVSSYFTTQISFRLILCRPYSKCWITSLDGHRQNNWKPARLADPLQQRIKSCLFDPFLIWFPRSSSHSVQLSADHTLVHYSIGNNISASSETCRKPQRQEMRFCNDCKTSILKLTNLMESKAFLHIFMCLILTNRSLLIEKLDVGRQHRVGMRSSLQKLPTMQMYRSIF